MRCGAVQCRALPCGAVLCRAVPCFAVFSLSFIPDDNASTHTVLARPSMYVLDHFMQLLSLFSIAVFHFPFFIRLQQTSSSGTYAAIYSSTAVCTNMYVVETRAQQGAAQSPCERQQTKHVPIRVRTKGMCTVTACCVLFVFLEHGALGIGKSPVYT